MYFNEIMLLAEGATHENSQETINKISFLAVLISGKWDNLCYPNGEIIKRGAYRGTLVMSAEIDEAFEKHGAGKVNNYTWDIYGSGGETKWIVRILSDEILVYPGGSTGTIPIKAIHGEITLEKIQQFLNEIAPVTT